MASRKRAILHNAILAAVHSAEHSTPRQRILDAASDIVHNDRNKQYGNPEDNFLNIARSWNAYLLAKGCNIQLSSHDVPIMMVLMKTARLATNPNHHDSAVDIAGYAACLGDIQESSARAYMESQLDSSLAVNQSPQTERNPKSK